MGACTRPAGHTRVWLALALIAVIFAGGVDAGGVDIVATMEGTPSGATEEHINVVAKDGDDTTLVVFRLDSGAGDMYKKGSSLWKDGVDKGMSSPISEGEFAVSVGVNADTTVMRAYPNFGESLSGTAWLLGELTNGTTPVAVSAGEWRFFSPAAVPHASSLRVTTDGLTAALLYDVPEDTTAMRPSASFQRAEGLIISLTNASWIELHVDACEAGYAVDHGACVEAGECTGDGCFAVEAGVSSSLILHDGDDTTTFYVAGDGVETVVARLTVGKKDIVVANVLPTSSLWINGDQWGREKVPAGDSWLVATGTGLLFELEPRYLVEDIAVSLWVAGELTSGTTPVTLENKWGFFTIADSVVTDVPHAADFSVSSPDTLAYVGIHTVDALTGFNATHADVAIVSVGGDAESTPDANVTVVVRVDACEAGYAVDHGACIPQQEGACTCVHGECGEDDRCTECHDGYFGADCAECPRCGEHGACNAGIAGTGSCVCDDGWSGAACSQCDDGYFGADCAECPQCGEHGACDDGNAGTGGCLCELGWDVATNCSECESRYFGPNCVLCTCENGECDDMLSGTGMCTECDDGWDGDNCDDCDDESFGLTCMVCDCVHGECVAGINGTGKCVPGSCEEGWQGEDCDDCADGYSGPNCVACPPCEHDGKCTEGGLCDCTDTGFTGPLCADVPTNDDTTPPVVTVTEFSMSMSKADVKWDVVEDESEVQTVFVSLKHLGIEKFRSDNVPPTSTTFTVEYDFLPGLEYEIVVTAQNNGKENTIGTGSSGDTLFAGGTIALDVTKPTELQLHTLSVPGAAQVVAHIPQGAFAGAVNVVEHVFGDCQPSQCMWAPYVNPVDTAPADTRYLSPSFVLDSGAAHATTAISVSVLVEHAPTQDEDARLFYYDDGAWHIATETCAASACTAEYDAGTRDLTTEVMQLPGQFAIFAVPHPSPSPPPSPTPSPSPSPTEEPSPTPPASSGGGNDKLGLIVAIVFVAVVILYLGRRFYQRHQDRAAGWVDLDVEMSSSRSTRAVMQGGNDWL